MEELKRIWGANIRAGRKALNPDGQPRQVGEPELSQEQLADLVGVRQQTVSDWETGEFAPRIPKQVKLAEVLHQDVRQLFPIMRGVAVA